MLRMTGGYPLSRYSHLSTGRRRWRPNGRRRASGPGGGSRIRSTRNQVAGTGSGIQSTSRFAFRCQSTERKVQIACLLCLCWDDANGCKH